MATERRAALVLFVTLLVACAAAAGEAPREESTEPVGRLPFRLDRNRVLLPVRIGGSEPLDLILDTGLGFDGVYLFHREFLETLGDIPFLEVQVPGAGSGAPSTARMADSVAVSSGTVTFGPQRVIVSTSERTQGFPTNGIIGWTLLGRFITMLDFDAGEILLFENDGYAPDSSWSRIDLVLKNNIPWIETAIAIDGDSLLPAQTYIDLAASDAVVILTGPGNKFAAPSGLEEKYLGTGLSGDVHGGIGRISRLRIGSFDLRDIDAAFAPAEVRSKQKGADAVLGCDAIRRFLVVFDYAGGALYLKPPRAPAQKTCEEYLSD
jgi:hypothetical protein